MIETTEKGQDGPDGFFVVPAVITVKASDIVEARSKVLGALDLCIEVQNVIIQPVRAAADSDMDGFDHL
jgi:hypothetical protein